MLRQSFLSVALLALACAPPSDTARSTAPQEVVFIADDYSFIGPDSIAPGVTALRMVNRGREDHHLILARFDEGKTLDSLMAALAAAPHAVPDWLRLVGAASAVSDGDSTGAVMDLEEGSYLALCLIPDQASGAPHIALGMVRPLMVTGARHEAPLPTNAIDIRLSEFAYQLPRLTAGTHTFRVVNDGVQPHEVVLFRLADGATIEELMAALTPGAAGPPPARAMGGSGALSGGGENYWTVSLAPGRYAVLCFVPDPVSGTPHLAMGMATGFSIE